MSGNFDQSYDQASLYETESDSSEKSSLSSENSDFINDTNTSSSNDENFENDQWISTNSATIRQSLMLSSSDSDEFQLHAMEHNEISDESDQLLGECGSPSKQLSTSSSETFLSRITPDSLSFIAILIPITGISTIFATELVACSTRFNCSIEYPTLSYAATFKPQGLIFTVGMTCTAFFIGATTGLFHWFLRLQQHELQLHTSKSHFICVTSGSVASISLFILAVWDMRNHHDIHITSTIIFFVFAWVTIGAVQHIRLNLLLAKGDKSRDSGLYKQVKFQAVIAWVSNHVFILFGSFNLQKPWNIAVTYQWGQLYLLIGISSTVMFGVMFVCVNGILPNPLGFTAVQEAFFEALAIFCQLLFMGTLGCELKMLRRLVERHEYRELSKHDIQMAQVR